MTRSTPAPPRSPLPHHRDKLIGDLASLGVAKGDIVLVHSSVRRIGPVIGGAASVVWSLLDVLGPSGTLVVPTFTQNNSDPSRWERTCQHPVPSASWPAIRDHMPAFDPALTPSFNVGVIAEIVRTWPGAVRSDHPQTSFAAVGAAAETLMASHPSNCHLGPETPLGKLSRTNAKVLLLGVSFAVCTAFHLAEYQIAHSPQREYECVVQVDGERRWYQYHDVLLDDSDFERLGEAFEASSDFGSWIRRGKIGYAPSRLFPMSKAVDFAWAWMSVDHRRSS
jgi:aminoglycoside 3-N-acetyltransferase